MNEAQSLVREIVEGESYELRVLAAQGILPLPFADLVRLQVQLASAPDAFLAEAARASLAGVDRRITSVYLATEAPPEVLRHFALEHRDPMLLEAVVRRRDVPRDLLVELAPALSADLQETLLLRQDAIQERPEILDALESNPTLSPFAARRVAEYREHLVPRAAPSSAVAVSSERFLAEEDADLSEEEREEIERIRRQAEASERDRTTGLSEHQIRSLSVPMRLKLARGASRTLRALLVRDINPNVAVRVLLQSAFAEDEIEQLAASRNVVDEVLLEIAKNRSWTARYGVCHSLARNPRVPVGIAVKFCARLSVRDLRILSRDRNVADAVRTTAQRLYRLKTA